MQKLIAQLNQAVDDFVDQRDDLVMILAGDADGSSVALKVLRDVEQSSASDVYLIFADGFADCGGWAEIMLQRFEAEHEMACDELEKEARAPYPAIPDEVRDTDRDPIERVHKLIEFCRSLIPHEGDHRLVVAMTPVSVVNRQDYWRLIESFIPRGGIQPWMRGVRIIFRDDEDITTVAPNLAHGPRVRLTSFDFSQESIEQSLEEEAMDESLSDGQRVGAVMQLAAYDYAYHRSAEAHEKYDYLLGYYQGVENLEMQAMVMCQKGDVYRRDKEYEHARYWYECALVPAEETKSGPVVQAVVRSLAELEHETGNYSHSVEYYDGLEKLAKHNHDLTSQVLAREGKARSYEEAANVPSAIEHYEDAAALSREVGLVSDLKRNLQHLERMYTTAVNPQRLMAVQQEQAELAE